MRMQPGNIICFCKIICMLRSVPEKPAYRKLKGYAFDPSLSLLIETVDINKIVYKVPWEEPKEDPLDPDSKRIPLKPGPVGEYIEVIDFDPTIKKFYAPVDLNDPYLLANDGLDPSESNPMFHQQMVYAVSMTTIKNFEKALGRKILWAPRLLDDTNKYEDYVPRLRIYPHAFRDANAYYSPLKKALLFGYFASTPLNSATVMPGSLVFTCLSHDIIAHEMTHAILDGLHRNYIRPTNPDVLAFHEAFADIVALFQHFTFPEVLKHQIAKTRGDLGRQNLLGELAVQFGNAIGRYGSLRDAIGKIVNGKWIPRKPDPTDYQNAMEAHDRGSILVAAIFEAFLSIYKSRIADLLRISTGGSGILPDGDLHPDLVNRLANEASKTAKHVLNMCIRAIDFCPPVDITFGDYLRAIITADFDLVSDDSHYYRLAFIDAFRRRGIYPDNIRTLSEDSLRHRIDLSSLKQDTKDMLSVISEFLNEYRSEVMNKTDRHEIYSISRSFIGGSRNSKGLHNRLWHKFDNSYEFEKITGLIFNTDFKKGKGGYDDGDKVPYQILNLRLVSRVGPDGNQTNQIIFSMVQRIGVVYENGVIREYYRPSKKDNTTQDVNFEKSERKITKNRFEVVGGCTLIFDLDTLNLKYAISKPLLIPERLDDMSREINMDRVKRQFKYQTEELPRSISEFSLYFEEVFNGQYGEPFALLHKH